MSRLTRRESPIPPPIPNTRSTAGAHFPARLTAAVLVAAGMGFHLFMTGATKASPIRYKVFGADFVERLKGSPEGQKLLADHRAATGAETDEALAKELRGGYPDTGSGRFAAFLTHAEWLAFNGGQRAHLNYVEASTPLLTFLLIGGLHAPVVAAAAGVSAIVGRELYARGYASKGPRGREIGAGVSGLSMLTLFGTAVFSGLKVARVL